MLNVIVLMGRLVADPELRSTSSGIQVCSFRIAVDRDFADKASGQRQADFIDIVVWRNQAEFVSRYFRKGQMITVKGALQSRKWQDKDGNNRVSWEVQADGVYFGESKNSGSTRDEEARSEPRTVTDRSRASGTPITPAGQDDEAFMPVDYEDIPF